MSFIASKHHYTDLFLFISIKFLSQPLKRNFSFQFCTLDIEISYSYLPSCMQEKMNASMYVCNNCNITEVTQTCLHMYLQIYIRGETKVFFSLFLIYFLFDTCTWSNFDFFHLLHICV